MDGIGRSARVALVTSAALLCAATFSETLAVGVRSVDDPNGRRLQIEVAATGGFAGVREAHVREAPHFICTAGTCVKDPNHIVLRENTEYNWKPTLSAGVVFRWLLTEQPLDPNRDAMGIGVGAHFVFVPRGDGTRAAPAITAHFGTSRLQAFFGYLFMPVDEADLPGGRSRAVVPSGTKGEDFIREDAGKDWNFFGGVVIGGVPITKP